MSNRKARRAAAANQSVNSATDIPLAQPIRDRPINHKTLYDIAAERHPELAGDAAQLPGDAGKPQPAIVTTKINKDGTLSNSAMEEEPDEDPIGPFGQAVFYATTLTMVHFTFDVLVHHQYRMEIGWDLITWRTITAFPVLVLLVHVLHPRSSNSWIQALYLAGSVVAGCYLVQSSNEEAYFAVMKRAPPLGTLWIWFVVESRLEVAIAGLAMVGLFFWCGGYTIF